MGDNDAGSTKSRLRFANQFSDAFPRCRIQTGGWFIVKNDLRSRRQRASDRQSLFLTTAQSRDRRRGGNTEKLKPIRGTVLRFAIPIGTMINRELHIRGRRQFIEQSELLEHDPGARHRFGLNRFATPVDVTAPLNRIAVSRQDPRQDSQQNTFARTTAADQHRDLSVRKRQMSILQKVSLAGRHEQAIQGQRVRQCEPPIS